MRSDERRSNPAQTSLQNQGHEVLRDFVEKSTADLRRASGEAVVRSWINWFARSDAGWSFTKPSATVSNVSSSEVLESLTVAQRFRNAPPESSSRSQASVICARSDSDNFATNPLS